MREVREEVCGDVEALYVERSWMRGHCCLFDQQVDIDAIDGQQGWHATGAGGKYTWSCSSISGMLIDAIELECFSA